MPHNRHDILQEKYNKKSSRNATVNPEVGTNMPVIIPPKSIVDTGGCLDSGHISLRAHPLSAGNGAWMKLASVYFDHKLILLWKKKKKGL